jgi:hypothetical protein
MDHSPPSRHLADRLVGTGTILQGGRRYPRSAQGSRISFAGLCLAFMREKDAIAFLADFGEVAGKGVRLEAKARLITR